jgi:hypothetical protein
MEDPDDTAVIAEREIKRSPSRLGMVLSFVVGLAAAVAPGYYAVKQAKIEASTAREESKKEAKIGYEALADPLEQFRSAITILDWRVQRLETEQSSRQSAAPIMPEPLLEPALKKAVPQTLLEANVAAAKGN